MKKNIEGQSTKKQLPKYDENMRLVRKLSRELIPKLLEIKPATGKSLVTKIKEKYPQSCDDSIKCQCGNHIQNRPEWEHQAQWAIQDLKHDGILVRDKKTNLYSISKKTL